MIGDKIEINIDILILYTICGENKRKDMAKTIVLHCESIVRVGG